MQWLLANAFLFALIIVAAGLMWALAAIMWHFNLPPDENPGITIAGMLLVLLLTYYLLRFAYDKLQRMR
jgi:divalent metal cation (Fe/Co/Zn/Cd) transporter